MRNVIILGSGRSGTSLVAGLFAQAGYFMGDKLWEAREANPKGFFEDETINELNEILLEPVVPKRLHVLGKTFFRGRPLKWQRWLTRLPETVTVPQNEQLMPYIKQLTRHTPYCFKDPRFSYTLPLWRPYLHPDTVFICVFRDPATTVASILKECQTAPYLNGKTLDIYISWKQGLRIWMAMYTYILKNLREKGEWLFLHYQQALSEDGWDRLTHVTGAKIDRAFPDSALQRTTCKTPVPRKARELYARLCQEAQFEPY